MVDLENAKKVFMEYVSNYDEQNININRKIYHSLRVMEINAQIAKSLELSDEEIEISTLIGLLHDIARFEQYRIYQTFSDKKSIDHGNLGVEILEKDNFIRKFIETDKYDSLIKTAIKNHNKFKIEDGLDEKNLLFCKMIRDADKLDIFYEAVKMFWNSKEEKSEIESTIVSEDYYQSLINCKIIEKGIIIRPKIDAVVFMISLIYDINFKFSFEYIIEKNLVNNMLDKYNYLPEAKKQIEQIKNSCFTYMKQKIK